MNAPLVSGVACKEIMAARLFGVIVMVRVVYLRHPKALVNLHELP